MEAVTNDRSPIRQLIARRIRKTIDERASLALASNTLNDVLGNEPIEIYEAGGGSRPVVAKWFPQARTTIVNLERTSIGIANGNVEFIEGDIRDFCPADREFDLVVSYYVLEHVPHPEKALEKFCTLTKSGGLVFIASPCFWSLNAIVAKLTPFWFHVWFYRNILNKPLAATKGKAPFRTHHSLQIDPSRLIEYFFKRDFEIIYQKKFLNNNFQKLMCLKPFLACWLEMMIIIMNFVSFRKHDFGEGDFHLIFQKKIG